MIHRNELTVYYDLSEDDRDFDRDMEAVALAGVIPMGSGVMLKTMTRDLYFRFENDQSLAEAKIRLKNAGFRFEP